MKKIILIVFIIQNSILLKAQIGLNFANKLVSKDWNGRFLQSESLLDNDNNYYISGRFAGTMDFDPDSLMKNMTSLGNSDIYLVKYNSKGQFLKALKIGGQYGDDKIEAMTCDRNNNLYIIGDFTSDSFDVDPDTSKFILVRNSGHINSRDIFVVKLDSAGKFIWGKSFGGKSNDLGSSIALDSNNDILIAGSFMDSADFDPSPNTSNLVTKGEEDAFLAKLSNTGNLKWALNIGGTGTDNSSTLSVDFAGNTYICGRFSNTADFDPSSSSFNLNSAGYDDVFIAKYNSSGDLIWAKKVGGSSSEQPNSCVLDKQSNIYIGGLYWGSGDYNPGSGVFNLTHSSNASYTADVFILKLDSLGNFIWAKKIGDTAMEWLEELKLDEFNNLYSIGSFAKKVDFDPGVGIFNLNSGIAGVAPYILKLNAINGSFIFAKQFYPWNSSLGYGKQIDIDKKNNIYCSGQYSFGDLSFDSNYNKVLIFEEREDIFIAKFCQTFTDTPSNNSFLQNLNICIGDSTSIEVTSVGLINWYSSPTGGSKIGTGNIFNTPKLFTTTNYYAEDSSVCGISVRRQIAVNVITSLNKNITKTTFSLNSNQIGATYQWLDCNNGKQAIIGENNQSFNPTKSGNYAVVIRIGNCKDTSNCISFTYCTKPNAPVNTTLTTYQVVCFNSSTNLSASGIGVLSWYDSDTGGTYLGSGTNYSTPNLLSNTNYYVQDSTCQSGPRTKIQVSVNPRSDKTITVNGNTLISNQTNANYQWVDCTNGNKLIVGQISQSFNPINSGSYAVIINKTPCMDTSNCINFIYCNRPNPPSNTTSTNQLTICNNMSSNLSAKGIGKLSWYNSAHGGIYLGGGNTYTTPKLTSNTDFYVQDSTCMSSIRTKITVNMVIINKTVTNLNGILNSMQANASYQWLNCIGSNKTSITGKTTKTFSPNATGSYAVSIMLGTCLDTSNCVNFVLSEIQDINLLSDLQIFPNPSNGLLFIKCDRKLKEFKISDICGRIVLENKNINIDKSIDISLLSNGIYYIEFIYSEDNKKQIKKFSLNKI